MTASSGSVRRLLWALTTTAVLLAAALAWRGPAPAADFPDELVCRPLPAAPEVKPLRVGGEVHTGPRERRRVMLPDGFAVIVNENTVFRMTERNRLQVVAGDILVDEASGTGGTLHVSSPKRELTANQDATFGVSVADGGTGLVVLRGAVSVEGLVDLTAGQQLGPENDKPIPSRDGARSLAWAADLMGEAPLVPASEYAGGSLVAVDTEGQDVKLGLRKFHIDVHIEDGFARTTIDQTYFNHTPQRLEGTFYFPLPPDASLSRLAMYVDGNLMEGGMVDRDYGRDVYETIVTRKKDPALLEWVDGGTFKMRVFPLEVRQEKRLVLSYVQKLPSPDGRLSYRFPACHSLTRVGDWSFHARVKNGANFAWNSPSHALKRDADGTDLVIDGSEKDVKLDRDVTLEMLDLSAVPDALRFAVAEQDGGKYYGVRWRPDLPGKGERRHRDWVFLFESSGDRDPMLARAQVEVVRGLLANAGPDDTASMVTAGARAGAPQTLIQPASVNSVQENFIRDLEKAHLVGALDLGGALAEAEPILKEAKNPYLVHVGGGFPALGERRTNELLKHLPPNTVYVGVGVGRRWNRAFMKAAAERTGGVFTQINPDEKIGWRTFELASSLDAPRLLNVTVKDKADRLSFLTTTDAAARGEEICAVARLDANAPLPEAVVVRGLLDGKPFERELAVKKPTAPADYLPRLWARLEIDRLLAEDAVKHKEDIVALSKAMYVMTPFTSLLVLENEEMYQQYKVERGRKDHWAPYPCPDKIAVVAEDEDGRPIDPTKQTKPSAREVLKTVLVRDVPKVLGLATQSEVTSETPQAVRIKERKEDFFLTIANETQDVGAAKMMNPLIVDPEIERRSRGGNFSDAPPTHKFETEPLGGRRTPVSYKTLPGFGMVVLPDDMPVATTAQATEVVQAGGNAALNQEWAFLHVQSTVSSTTPMRANLRFRSPSEAEYRRMIELNETLEQAMHRPGFRFADLPLLYRRPNYSGDDRLFYDLTAYAPGLHTSAADARAVLDAEADPDPNAKPGVVEDGARALIDKARRASWQALTFPADGDQPSWTLSFDGEGRYAYERTLPIGLRERVVCDGKTLLHLYPDLGLGARRVVSRFHRLAFTQLVPWALPPTDDLAHGADVRLVGERTVAIFPHGADAAKDADGKPTPYTRLLLIFAEDGRLAERWLMKMPPLLQKALAWETYAADGAVTSAGADGKERTIQKASLTAVEAPDLDPDVKDLVILPTPARTIEQVRGALKLEKRAYSDLHFDEGLSLLAACYGADNGDEAAKVFQQCFRDRDQRGLGFFVLLAACGQNLDGEHIDVLTDHPHDPLAQYLALYSSPVLRKHASQWAVGGAQWGDGFLQRLAVSHALYQRWQNGKAVGGTDAQRQAERDRALDYVRRNKGTTLGFALLGLLEDRARDDEANKKDAAPAYRAQADAWLLFADAPGLEYVSRYENARCLWKGGNRAEARKRWRALYEKRLADDALPAIDGDFRQALLGEGAESDEWSDLLQKTAARLVEQKHRAAAFALATQCWQLGDGPSADRTLAVALNDVEELKEGRGNPAPTLQEAAVAFYEETGRLTEADALLQELLGDPRQANRATLWREAAGIAERREAPARELECLEKALDAEYRNLPEIVNLEAVRRDYGKLLNHYQRLADALAVLKTPAPPDFIARVVRAADRWRALDGGAPQACELAARVLRSRGERDLAWDYLTTPVGLRPNEAAPWVGLARDLSRQGDLGLADRAYAAACDAEPTDAQMLWDRAQNLRQSGQLTAANALYRRLADGTWQPRFQWIQRQAREQVKAQ